MEEDENENVSEMDSSDQWYDKLSQENFRQEGESSRGNRDRGWNDPPIFMYNADGQKVQSSSGALKKNPLTQRVAMPQNYGSPISKTEISPSKPQRNTPVSGAPPCCIKPSQGSSCPPTIPATCRPSEIKVEANNEPVSLPEDICNTSMAQLTGVLQKCQTELKARIADDIKKRLGMLEDAWNSSKLSAVVQQRMTKLAAALADRDYDTAHDLHLSLMVDYVSEVSQWMVGIKRLIMEARTVLPYRPLEPSSDVDSEQHAADNVKQSEPHSIDNGKEMKPNKDCPGQLPDEPNLGSQESKTEDPEPAATELKTGQEEPKPSENSSQSGITAKIATKLSDKVESQASE